MLDKDEFLQRGYQGFKTFEVLRSSLPDGVEIAPGTYVVLWDGDKRPLFALESCGGHFKGKNPTVPVETLEEEWIDGARILYIGKADNLRRRLNEYCRFGVGHPVGHWGGRYIWQLNDCQSLVVAWKPLLEGSDARAEEKALLGEFVAQHGRRPFANLTG